jgi:hypothetical protein
MTDLTDDERSILSILAAAKMAQEARANPKIKPSVFGAELMAWGYSMLTGGVTIEQARIAVGKMFEARVRVEAPRRLRRRH